MGLRLALSTALTASRGHREKLAALLSSLRLYEGGLLQKIHTAPISRASKGQAERFSQEQVTSIQFPEAVTQKQTPEDQFIVLLEKAQLLKSKPERALGKIQHPFVQTRNRGELSSALMFVQTHTVCPTRSEPECKLRALSNVCRCRLISCTKYPTLVLDMDSWGGCAHVEMRCMCKISVLSAPFFF